MYSNKSFGFSQDLLKAVAGVMRDSRNMTKAQIQERIDSGVWSADTPILEGKEALFYDRQLNRRFSVNVIEEKKDLDPVDKKAVKKDFDDRKDKDIDNDGDTDDSDEYLHKRRKAISKAMKDEASCGTKRMKEDEDLEEETVYVKRRYNNLGANQYSNDVGFAKKISNAASKLGLTAKMNDKNFVISGDPEKIATLKKTVKGVTFSMKEELDLEEGKKDYKKESDDSSNDDTMTDAQKNDMDGDGDKDKKGKKKKNGEREKVDTVDTDPEMKDDTMVQEEKSFKTPYGTVKVTKRDTKGKGQDPYLMTLHTKDGKTKNLGSHPNPTDSAVNSIVKRHMSEESDLKERGPRKLASYEREKLDSLKKKHEGGKMHRALKRQYGDKGDEIFYGKLTKMAKGEYDGSQSKSEEFQLTAEDLNDLAELQRLGQEWELEEAIHIEKGKKISPKQADKFLRSINARGVTRYFDLRSTEVNDLIDFGKKNGHLGGMGILKDGPKYLEYLNSLADKGTKKEDVDLEEARGRPKKGDDADDAGSGNIIMQLRKAVSLRGQHTVKFDDGSKVKVDMKKAQDFLNKFNSLQKPAEKEALMKSAAKSPKHLDMAIQGKVAKDKKPPMLPPLKSEE